MRRFLASNSLAILSLIAIKNSQRESREGQGARAHQSSFCPGARGWLSPALISSKVNQNNGEVIKFQNLILRAETALKFSKHFRLDVESMLVKESNTGKKHTVIFETGTRETQDSTVNSEPGEKNNRYNSLSLSDRTTKNTD